MKPSFSPLTLDVFQDGQTLDPRLLTAARLHVGAAGIEQTASLERLIAAGQQHTGLVQAARQVANLLEQAEVPQTSASPSVSEVRGHLLRDSRHLLTVLNELETVVSDALQQITATPVQRISAQCLEDIAGQMQGHLSTLETLIAAAENSPAVPDASTPALEAILGRLRADVARIGAEQRQGHLNTLETLISQAVANLADYEAVPPADRARALNATLTEIRQRLQGLQQPSA